MQPAGSQPSSKAGSAGGRPGVRARKAPDPPRGRRSSTGAGRTAPRPLPQPQRPGEDGAASQDSAWLLLERCSVQAIAQHLADELIPG